MQSNRWLYPNNEHTPSFPVNSAAWLPVLLTRHTALCARWIEENFPYPPSISFFLSSFPLHTPTPKALPFNMMLDQMCIIWQDDASKILLTLPPCFGTIWQRGLGPAPQPLTVFFPPVKHKVCCSWPCGCLPWDEKGGNWYRSLFIALRQ